MATVTYIKESKQHISAMKAVMCYCQREDKTTDPQTGHRYVSGVDCNGASSFTEFLATKTAYGKLDGINFYQYVQSFSPRENVTYEQAHALWNRAHNPAAETLYLPTDPRYAHISSTRVRAAISAGESLRGLVPPALCDWIATHPRGGTA